MKYKITELYPQAEVRLVHYVNVKNEKELKQAKESPGDFSENAETDIDYGGEVYTEKVEKME